MTQYPKDTLFDTSVLLDTVCPESLLIIGEPLFNFADEYQQQCQVIKKQCHITELPATTELNHAAFSQRYDLAIIADILETKKKIDSEQLIGRLRDLCTPQFILLADLYQCDWLENELLGFGLNKFKTTINKKNESKPHNIVIYQYNIDSYKKTPDWFNPKSWANPNLWNKFWW